MAMAVERCRLLEYIGKNTLPILVMHKFPILLFQVAGPLKNPLSQYDSVAGIAAAWLVTLIAIALCLAAAWFIRRFLPFMLGDVSFLPVRREKPRKHG